MVTMLDGESLYDRVGRVDDDVPAQVILNGHEYMDRQARKAGILFTREGNCFSHISDLTGFARIAETLADESATGRIAAVCRRWIYSTCVNYALDVAVVDGLAGK